MTGQACFTQSWPVLFRAMKNKVALSVGFFCIMSMVACTQDSVVRNTALRHVVVKFDADLAKNPDAQAALEIRKKTKIEVTDLTMVSDKEANATVTIKSVLPSNRAETTTQAVPVHLVKDSVWSVRE